jgi:signal transduction histidine kinase/ActR/RegA family two-component response regulator/HAMP domain-containing protein
MVPKLVKKFSSVRMQLVASVFLWISPALVLTFIVNQNWFWEFAPAWVRQYALSVPWASFIVGVLALIAAWYGGEHFIRRQVQALTKAVLRLSSGDLQARTGLKEAEGELGQLAQKFDEMADALQKRQKERDEADRKLLNRAMQQTAVSAVGQCALTNKDLEVIYEQAVYRVAEMFGVEYAMLFQRMPDGKLHPLAVYGCSPKTTGDTSRISNQKSQMAWTADTGEVSVVNDWNTETNYGKSPLLTELGVVSGVAVAIPTREKPFGVLAAHTTHRREFSPDDVQFLLAIATVISMATERIKAEAETEKLATFVKENPNAALELSGDGSVNYFNVAAEKLAAVAGKTHSRELLPEPLPQIVKDCLASGQSQTNYITKINDQTISWSLHPMPASGVVHCYGEDITSRLNLEDQLRQSQKMESIGQLAAGVAHDFNNMLTIIQGHSSRLLSETTLPPQVLDPVLAIYGAAERAAGLTRQLLMFTRKNVMQPSVIDLREIVGNMNKMLGRLLGETIALEFHVPARLPTIYGDSGMIEQVLMNLAVNAHDAMPEGGTLTISLEEFWAGPEYVERNPGALAGQLVRLQVSDTGFGMTEAVRARIFEPFFTTKEVGKGTGLGLATVFGIVRQHSGWIEVFSEVGKGTMFTVYFPACDEALPVEAKKTVVVPAAGGSETILVAEDEMVLREMACEFLKDSGYRVLEAASGREAIRVWQQHRGEIDLLLTDMKMPEGISGLDIAEHMLAEQPGLRIIFTSGYSDDVVSPEILERCNGRFLAKPYAYADLVRQVRECLDHQPAAS